MTRRHWIWIAIGLALTITALVWAFRPQPVPVETAEVRRGLFAQTIDEDGKTRVRERYVVAAPVAGQLARVRVKAGDAVRAGAPVAVLSPPAPAMIDARTARELNERIAAANAARRQAQARVARAEAGLEQAQVDLARQKRLQGEGFVAAAALDQAELAVRVQTRESEAARFAHEQAAHELDLARAALLHAQEGAATRRAGTEWQIGAPVDGRVLRVLQESETVVGIGTPLLEIGDPTDLEVVVDVLSTERLRIADGARVEIDAGGGLRLEGRVQRVEPAAFTKVSALGVEEQRVNVILDFAGPLDTIWTLGDAFRVEAHIVTYRAEDAVKVPVGALFREGEGWAVFVAQDGAAAKRAVRVARRNGAEAMVEDGLAAGERVIVYPSDALRDGSAIEISSGRP